MLKTTACGHLSWNKHKSIPIPVGFPMYDKNVENEEYVCGDIKVVVVFPKVSSGDDVIKQEIREIMISALHEQLIS